MNYLGRVFGNLRGFYSGINGATLTGAIDVVVVEQEDGTFKCSPFHVRFGKLGVLRSKEKVVDIEVNEVPVPIRMKLGDTGEAFFVQEVDSEEELDDEYLATSPLPGSPRQMDFVGQLETITSEETTPTKTNVEVTISIEDEEVEVTGTGTPVAFESPIKTEDGKGRKRRKKKRRNQGSKSDIKIDILESPLEGLESSEPIFRMDEELSNVSEALKNLDTLSHNRSFHRDFYSDTEVEATSTPPNSRPATPIQSDSEYEISKTHKSEDVDVGKWVWGELPSTVTTTPAITPTGLPLNQLVASRKLTDKGDEILLSHEEALKFDGENKSMLSGMAGMFSFMKRNNQQGASSGGDPGSSGIYLDDLNLENMDPEVAALYFPTYQKEPSKPDQDEDGESGKGSSLPQSPAPGSSPKMSQIASHMEEHRKRNESSSSESQSKFEAISLCGNSLGLFEQSQLSYDELVENPELLLSSSPESIVVKIDGKFVPWSAALPQLLSTTFFKRPLPQNVYQRLIDHYVKKEEGLGSEGSGNVSSSSSTSKDAASKKGFSWFSWRKPQDPEHSTSENPLNVSPESGSPSESNSPNSKTKGSPAKMIQNGSLKQHIASVTSSSDESEGGGGIRGKPVPVPDRIGRSSTLPASIPGATTTYDKYKKTLRLNSDQIAALGLKSGQNEAVFSVTTAYQGTSVARCHIYLWRYDDRVVVSDIDGTITKSDVLGHILPIIGKDWAQSGVAQLFTQIHANGYKMLYLSARAIGQAAITREYLRSIRQGDVTLPDGPLLLNPTSLMAAFHREVIEKKPEEFKIACLKDIQTLFPRNPFYAGYGNRINDVYSYRAVDINISRIFTINHKGELRHALTNTFQSSYTSLVELAEHIFPAYKSRQSFTEIDGYSTFEFWREPLPPIASPVDKTPEELRFGRPRSNTIV